MMDYETLGEIDELLSELLAYLENDQDRDGLDPEVRAHLRTQTQRARRAQTTVRQAKRAQRT
jgi:hypothetical protein